MRLSADWLTHPGTVAVFDALCDHRAWFVGGCVRDGLLGRAVDDIDICTDAHPHDVITSVEAASLKVVPTGIDHGTVTVIAHDKSFEITTLRRDIETDGRHAQVAFSTDIAEDAARRDFTINALYATREGDILDPNGTGLPDLSTRRVRFIGDPDARITEDYLRILRFFRFHAWYADPAHGMDADALAACAANLQGLPRLSKERIGTELLKLLRAPDPAPAIAAMDQTGVLTTILPGASSRMLTILSGYTASPLARLASLGGAEVADNLRLSKADAKTVALYRAEIGTTTQPGALAYHHGADAASDIIALRAAAQEMPLPDVRDAITKGAAATFPVKAADLPHLSGPALGQHLRALESRWIDSDFTLTKAELLS
ncbi:CCA tRNA nucleotidyltransferase [Hasllibacter sp. MH4015]|uniref:CCA tRNA nucleotidyltransferase n=1 Tax=Hasllibacter sp. MH4015 TaxID=2854029 RepID=UPI001CD73F9E|nr:CCA tRNA nucleotidyltransferase [Hasllibacter sp. MH4015]